MHGRAAHDLAVPDHGPGCTGVDAAAHIVVIRVAALPSGVAADKAQRIAHDSYRRVDRFRLGKRQVALLQPVS